MPDSTSLGRRSRGRSLMSGASAMKRKVGLIPFRRHAPGDAGRHLGRVLRHVSPGFSPTGAGDRRDRNEPQRALRGLRGYAPQPASHRQDAYGAGHCRRLLRRSRQCRPALPALTRQQMEAFDQEIRRRAHLLHRPRSPRFPDRSPGGHEPAVSGKRLHALSRYVSSTRAR